MFKVETKGSPELATFLKEKLLELLLPRKLNLSDNTS